MRLQRGLAQVGRAAQLDVRVVDAHPPLVAHKLGERHGQHYGHDSDRRRLGVGDKGACCVAALQQQMDWVRDACRGRATPPVVCVQWPDPRCGGVVAGVCHFVSPRPKLCVKPDKTMGICLEVT